MLTLVTAYEKLTRFDEANDMMDQLMDFASRESEFLLKKVKLLARVERFDEALETVIECIEGMSAAHFQWLYLANCVVLRHV